MRTLIYILFLLLIANTNLFSQTVLINSIKNLNTELAIELINKGADVNEYLYHKENHTHSHNCLGHDYNRSPLYWAVLRGDYKVTELLLEKGANINFINTGGKTALHMAVMKYDIKMVSILINNGANINISDNKGNTSILLASYGYTIETNKNIKNYYKEIIKLLLNNKANVNKENKNKQKPTDYNIINELTKNYTL